MCGFLYNVSDFSLLAPLLEIAGYDKQQLRDLIGHKQLRPTDTLVNLIPSRQGLRLLGATWWLATHVDGRPNAALATFNARAAKLTTSALHLSSPRSIRSVVVASGFCEWQPIYKGDLLHSQLPGVATATRLPKAKRKQQFLIEHRDNPLLLLGAVSKLRLDASGQPKVNTALITLPPHADFVDIHHKSFPLVLNPDELLNWLDPSVPMHRFGDLLCQTRFRHAFRVTPVDANLHQTGPATVINS